MNLNTNIKSVRIYTEDGIIKIDYRVKPTVKLPKGKKGNRFRTSTGEKYSSIASKAIERNKFKLAQEHYESLFDNLENKEEVLFEDIAYLALKEAEADRKKHDATKDYKNILEADILPTFGNMNVKEIKAKDIKSWMLEMSEQNISQSRFNKKYYVVKRVLDYALENEYINSNPIALVKRSSKLFSKPKDKSNDYFSKVEMKKILDDNCENGNSTDRKNHLFINTFMHLAFYTGARTGEIMALKIDDIDLKNSMITFQRSVRKGIISTTKTGKSRTVPIIGVLSLALQKYIETIPNKTYLFYKPYFDKPYSDSRSIVDIYYKPMLRRLAIPFRVLYNTRHTFASIAVENQIPLSIISKCLGHSTISTTERFYLQFGNADKTEIKNQLENLAS